MRFRSFLRSIAGLAFLLLFLLTAFARPALAQSDESSVIGGGHLSLAGATLLNGYLITAVTMCDVHRSTMTHVTPEVVPPKLLFPILQGASLASQSGRLLVLVLWGGISFVFALRWFRWT